MLQNKLSRRILAYHFTINTPKINNMQSQPDSGRDDFFTHPSTKPWDRHAEWSTRLSLIKHPMNICSSPKQYQWCLWRISSRKLVGLWDFFSFPDRIQSIFSLSKPACISVHTDYYAFRDDIFEIKICFPFIYILNVLYTLHAQKLLFLIVATNFHSSFTPLTHLHLFLQKWLQLAMSYLKHSLCWWHIHNSFWLRTLKSWKQQRKQSSQECWHFSISFAYVLFSPN